MNDDSSEDAYGDTCTSWYDAYEGPGSSGCEGAYDDDDFTASVQCCVCQGEAREGGSNNNVLSTNDALNKLMHADAIATYKKLSKTAAEPTKVSATTIVYIDSHGDITYEGGSSESSRDVSYVVSVSCDTCLSGGPYTGEFSSGADNELLVYGFDADSDVCASVTATSTELGSTEPSETVCTLAGEQSVCELFDCAGQEYCGFEGYIGDGFCDDGSWGYYFNCAAFDCDGGDCLVECWDGSTACAGSSECPEEPTCIAGDVNADDTVNVSDIVVLVNYILGGGTSADGWECGDMNADGTINVSDIVQVVNYILGGGTARLDSAENADIIVTNTTISVEADGFVQGVQLTLTHEEDFSIDLADGYISDYRTVDNTTTLVIVTDGSESLSEVATISGKCTVESATVATPDGEAQTEISFEFASAFEVKVVGPNPFNPSTSLNVIVDKSGYVSVKVYNLVGQQVATLADGYMDANSAGYTVHWNASNMASGVYLVRAESAGQVSTQKLMLLK